MSQSNTTQTFFVRDVSGYRPITGEQLVAAAKQVLAQKFTRGCTLAGPSAMRDYLICSFGLRQSESFVLILLDSRHQLIACLEMFRGTIDGAAVHVREVVKTALKYNAAAAVIAHNHPSGVPEPTQADELITRRLKDALALVDIRLLDHLVIGGSEITSFSE